VLEALERSHDVLAVNLAGHVGGPEMADTPVSVDALVDAVERDLDAAGFDTADVVGNSLGGWIAFELATRGRARSVVALAPAGGWEQGSRAERRLRMLFTRNHKFATALLPRIDSLTRRPRLRRALMWQLAAHGERISPAAAAQMVRDSAACPVYFELMDAILRDGPPRAFDGVTCPVLLAWARATGSSPHRATPGACETCFRMRSGSSCQGSATSRCSTTQSSWRGRSPSSWGACANRPPSAATR
jgi:pimeloyl-ACP methyl ester carboxylesterase